MAKKEVLRVEHVGMKFNLSQEKVDDLKDYIIKLIKGQLKYNEFWGIEGYKFYVEERRPFRDFGTKWSREEYIAESDCRRS